MGKLCGKAIKDAKNGASRGFCSKERHIGACGNSTCPGCGVPRTADNTRSVNTNWSLCRACAAEKMRLKRGGNALNYQVAGEQHTFARCGCVGTLPKKRGESNLFVSWIHHAWVCRVSRILHGSKKKNKGADYTAIDASTPHTMIRAMMENELCVLCNEPLSWDVGRGTTPHLHHDHDSGAIVGFSHPKCNPLALQREITILKKQLQKAA
jgi:hypothetical protein